VNVADILSLAVLRPRDLLAIKVDLYNFKFQQLTTIPHGQAAYVMVSGLPARIIIEFPPQHIFEEAIYEGSGPPSSPAPPLQSRISGPSYLVFDAQNVQPFRLTLSNLLEVIRGLPLVLAPVAEPDSNPGDATHRQIAEPHTELSRIQTQIEAPYRLVISPTSSGRWYHTAAAPPQSGIAELWHTRLGRLGSNGSGRAVFRDDLGLIRAIWDKDPECEAKLRDEHELQTVNASVPHEHKPFVASLDAADRYNFIQLTSNYNLDSSGPFTAPVEAHRLMLSSLGAWLDFEGHWAVMKTPMGKGGALSVSSWLHRATMGRDQFVRVVSEGFLYPSGHRAALVKITERKVPPESQFKPARPAPVAYLRQRLFIILRETEKRYGDDDEAVSGSVETLFHGASVPLSRVLPFQRLRIVTLQTPNLDREAPALPDLVPTVVPDAPSLFWPTIGGADFKFHMVGQDRDGRDVEFRAPLLFVAVNAYSQAVLQAINGKYNALQGTSPWTDRRSVSFNSARVAYAPSRDDSGGTVFPTGTIQLGAALLDNAAQLVSRHELAFRPVMLNATVDVVDLQHLAKTDANQSFRYFEPYVRTGFVDLNPREVFGWLCEPAALDFTGQADRSGAVATPNVHVTALSRHYGPIGGTETGMQNASFDPDDYFDDAEPKLLGAFPLNVLARGAPFPVIKRTGLATTYSYEWTAVPLDADADVPGLMHGSDTQLTLGVVTELTEGAATPSVTITGELKAFGVELPTDTSLIAVKFDWLRFAMSTGRKPEIDAQLGDPPIEFEHDLAFVNALAECVDKAGFSDPPAVDVTDRGIAASYSLALPDVAIGAFALKNLKLSAALTLSFLGDPANLRLSFAERHAPCIVSMGPFAGGGFLAIETNAEDLQVLELALEFGAQISANFGVASGSIYAMGGIYLKWGAERSGALSGYFRMGGEVDVLGLISASIELYLALTYQNGKAVGSASISIEVEVCFFSFSVSVLAERRFAGSGADPGFRELYGPYYVHGSIAAVLHTNVSAQVLYLDPYNPNGAYIYDPASETYNWTFGPQEGLRPLRPGVTEPPKGAARVDPWLQYCRAFAL
jgi:hypothetical protein